MARGVEPFATWYYLFAWYGVLLAADGAHALLAGRAAGGAEGPGPRFHLLGRRAYLLTLMAWSAVLWLFYELLNFRLQNWYYVFLPEPLPLRWAGAVAAFATVLPAVMLSEALLNTLGVARTTRWRGFSIRDGTLERMRIAGAVMLVLVLILPGYFFPLVWGATALLVEPLVYRKAPERSLLHDLERGRPGRLLRLLLGGAAIGLLWEIFNAYARTKWIYTVPFFDELKLFEMPVLGFLGFPPFAVECWVLWQMLVLAGVAVPRAGARMQAPLRRRVAAAALAPAFALFVLAGMETRTFSSVAPRIAELPGVPQQLEHAGVGAFRLARTDAAALATRLNVTADEAAAWIETARLATLRGIGARDAALLHTVGIRSIEELARADVERLLRQLEQLTGRELIAARVRVWVRGAQDAVRTGTAAAP
jgi:hypothetical protein